MKITRHRSSGPIAIGKGAVESFEITPRQLRVWNYLKNKDGGITYNENWNQSQGLPCPEARAWLKAIHSRKFGTCDPEGQVTWHDIQNDMR
jgi:hypothetical protein